MTDESIVQPVEVQIVPVSGVIPDNPAVVSVPEPETPPEPDWIENTWQMQPHYECLRCPFDTLDPDAMAQHLDVVHPYDALGTRQKVAGALTDRYNFPLPPKEE